MQNGAFLGGFRKHQQDSPLTKRGSHLRNHCCGSYGGPGWVREPRPLREVAWASGSPRGLDCEISAAHRVSAALVL